MKINSVTVGIPVPNLEKSIEWYRKLLGDIESFSPAEGIWEICVTPSFTLQLFELEAEESSMKNIGFESTDIEESHKLVTALGVTASEIEIVPDTVSYFEFSDPFGNLLSFYQVLAVNA
ncbi:VOC family protein [Neptuniibacter sp. QD37_6]|uniref:VOC family protein n=1 Tax=Neptuniibacter sp. QD37_6 TaxID=3398210 RepID=UPI0039F5E2C7